jgi:hypothetical protein
MFGVCVQVDVKVAVRVEVGEPVGVAGGAVGVEVGEVAQVAVAVIAGAPAEGGPTLGAVTDVVQAFRMRSGRMSDPRKAATFLMAATPLFIPGK